MITYLCFEKEMVYMFSFFKKDNLTLKNIITAMLILVIFRGIIYGIMIFSIKGKLELRDNGIIMLFILTGIILSIFIIILLTDKEKERLGYNTDNFLTKIILECFIMFSIITYYCIVLSVSPLLGSLFILFNNFISEAFLIFSIKSKYFLLFLISTNSFYLYLKTLLLIGNKLEFVCLKMFKKYLKSIRFPYTDKTISIMLILFYASSNIIKINISSFILIINILEKEYSLFEKLSNHLNLFDYLNTLKSVIFRITK